MSALVASLLAVGSAPAGAAEIKTGDANAAVPSVRPTFSACVGAATNDAGFTDLGTLDAAVGDINCIAHFGISAGKADGTFDPNSNVTRSQMALFLYAAANKAGIDLMGGAMMADYGDIAELGENRQNAIKALARNGIMSGSGGNFRPQDDITRAEMAMALVNLVRKASPHLFVQRGVNAGALIIASNALDWFADARQTVPRAVDTAISYAYELGITGGYPDATFRPNDPVPRRNMATFITNALAHTNARPVGLSVQSDNGTLHASVRDANHEPVSGLRVDAFYVSDARVDRAFDNIGRCRSIVRAVETATSRCTVDRLDPITNSDGNAQFEPLSAVAVGRGVTVWTWTGDLGDKFDLGATDWVEFNQGPLTSPNAATQVDISPSPAKTPHVRFGDTIEFTLQLQYIDDRGTTTGADADSDDVAKSTAVGVQPSQGGATYQFAYVVFNGVASALQYDSDATRELFALTATGHDDETPDLVTDGSAQVAVTRRGLVVRSATETLTTDGNGQLSFSLTTTDPSPSGSNDYRSVAYVLIPGDNAPMATGGAHTGYVVFSERSPYLAGLQASPRLPYRDAPSTGGSTGNRITVSALNQYHEPLGGQNVELSSNRNDLTSDPKVIRSVFPGARPTSGHSGVVYFSYTHKDVNNTADDNDNREMITATPSPGAGPPASLRGVNGSVDGSGTFTHSGGTAITADEGTCTNGAYLYYGNIRHRDDDTNPATPSSDDDGTDGVDSTRDADVMSGRCAQTTVDWHLATTNSTTGVDTDGDLDRDTMRNILSGSIADGEIIVDWRAPADATDGPGYLGAEPRLVRYDENDVFESTADPGNIIDMEAFEMLLARVIDPSNPDPSSGTLGWRFYDHDDRDDRTHFIIALTPTGR